MIDASEELSDETVEALDGKREWKVVGRLRLSKFMTGASDMGTSMSMSMSGSS